MKSLKITNLTDFINALTEGLRKLGINENVKKIENEPENKFNVELRSKYIKKYK